jgi:glycosyltransferase involved in cell wall biosynthesis
VRVHVVDPSAYTPPYDHALCRALASAGAEVELFTSRFVYGRAPAPEGYARRELFYRAALGAPGSRLRRATKLAEHVPDMLRYRRAARAADVVHFQWLAVQHLDAHLLPRRAKRLPTRSPHLLGPTANRPSRRQLVLTAHDIMPREPRPGQLAAQRRLYERFDAVVVHSGHGRARLVDELGVDPERVHVIPHGAFVASPAERPSSPPPLPAFQTDVPVVLFFGLLRPYKGLDLLLDAWRDIDDAELWVVGMPRMDISSLRVAAPPSVRFVPRFVPDAEAAAYFARADLLVLPYREIDQSGVAFTALGAGVPMLLSDVGGFPELAATGAARTFPAGSSTALRDALRELLSDPGALAAMTERAHAAASGSYSWDAVARRTLDLYESLS